MTRFSRQADLFTQEFETAARADWFILPLDMIKMEKERETPIWSLDTMTPFFNIRLQALSPLMLQATHAVVAMNTQKPLQSPLTRESFMASGALGATIIFDEQGHRRNDNGFSQILDGLVKKGVLQVQDEAARGKNKSYVLANPHFEEWYRVRCVERRPGEDAKKSFHEKRHFAPAGIIPF